MIQDHWTIPLQCLALGLALGDREFRAKLDPADFSETEFECAISELQRGGGFTYLQRVLVECGALWEHGEGVPADAVLDSLKRTTRFVKAVRVMKAALRDVLPSHAPDHQNVFWERLEELEQLLAEREDQEQE